MKTIETTIDEKARILSALSAFISQRSGIEYADYGEREAFMGDYRPILKDGKTARILLRAVELSGVTADGLKEAFRAYSGRLSWDGTRLDYCTGQYFPTEYRRAACAVLSTALWDHYRNDFAAAKKAGESDGDAIRRNFRRTFGRGIASTWFN